MYRLGKERLESSLVERHLGVLFDSKFNLSQQCTLTAKRVKCILGCSIPSSAPGHRRDCPALLCSVWPHLQRFVQFQVLQYKKDIETIREHLNKGTKLVKDLEGKMYEEWLMSLGLSPERRRLRGVSSSLMRDVERQAPISPLW